MLQCIAINVDKETGVEEAPSVVNYEIDITHVRSVIGNYTSVSYNALPQSTIVSWDPNRSGGTQVGMKRGHLLLSRVPVWREIKVCARGPAII